MYLCFILSWVVYNILWSRKPHFDHLPVLCMIWVSVTVNNQSLWGETLTHSSTSLTWFSLKRLLNLFNYVFFFTMSLTDLWHHPWSLEYLFTLWICLCFIVLPKAIPPSSPETKHFLPRHILLKCQLVLVFLSLIFWNLELSWLLHDTLIMLPIPW